MLVAYVGGGDICCTGAGFEALTRRKWPSTRCRGLVPLPTATLEDGAELLKQEENQES